MHKFKTRIFRVFLFVNATFLKFIYLFNTLEKNEKANFYTSFNGNAIRLFQNR